MSDGVFGKFEQIGPIRVSPYFGPGATAKPIRISPYVGPGSSTEPKEVSGWRIVALTTLVFLVMVLGARFIVLGILAHPGSALYQKILSFAFMCSILGGLYGWALVTSLRSRRELPKKTESLYVRTKGAPPDAILAVVRIRNLTATKGWIWIQNGKLWFSGEYFWFCLGPADFRSKLLFYDQGTPLMLPKGLCLRQLRMMLFEPDGRPLDKKFKQLFQSRVQSEPYDDPGGRFPTVFPPLFVPCEPINWSKVWAGSVAVGALFAALGASLYFLLPEFDGVRLINYLNAGLMMGIFPLIWPLMVLTQDQATKSFAKDEAKFRRSNGHSLPT